MATDQELLIESLEFMKSKPSEFYMYDGHYCDEVGCDGCDEHYGKALDVEYHVSMDKTYISVLICVNTGGPNIFLDTKRCCLIGYWGQEKEDVIIDYRIADKVDGFWEQVYNCS